MIAAFRSTVALLVVCLASTAAPSASNAAEKNEAMQRMLDAGKKIRQITLCAEYPRRDAAGPRDSEDLSKVSTEANAGASSCQYLLGRWNEFGEGMPINLTTAQQLYQSAAPSYPLAKVALGRMAEQGVGGPASPAEALTLYQEASAADETSADIAIGSLYERGLGIEKDLKVAAASYRKAAARWNDDGFGNLDRLQSTCKCFTEEETAADRKHWQRLFYTRVQNQIGKTEELKQFKETRAAALQLTYTRDAAEPAVEVLSPSGDPAFDAVIAQVGQRVPMPPAPVYSDPNFVFKVSLRVLADEPAPAGKSP